MQERKKIALERKALFIRVAAILLPLAIMMLLLSQKVFAQTTYVITDGSRVLVHTTSATDPKDVLGEAGLELDANDTYTTQASDGIAEIQVRRSQSITIDYYGQHMQTTSFGETVAQLLTRLNLSWSQEDFISLPLDAQTFDGMCLTVAHVIRQEQTYTAQLPYEVLTCSDSTVPSGVQRVLTEGKPGEMLCTATVTYVNGVETQRNVHSQDVTVQPVNQVIAIGTGTEVRQEKEKLPVIGDGIITMPTGEVLTYTGMRTCLATAYCDKGLTATGTQARVGAIAVDPSCIPYGTRMFIVSEDGNYVYGIATAEDCGSTEHIYGSRIDLHYDTYEQCVQFGARNCLVYFLG